MLEYLRQYATHYSLESFITFNSSVEKVVPVRKEETTHSNADQLTNGGDDQMKAVTWEVSWRNASTDVLQTEQFDFVLVCNG